MKKKTIMGLEYKWEVLLVYLVCILGFIFSFMKNKDVDKDVKFQYNQSAVIFIFNAASYFISNFTVNIFNIPYISWTLSIIQIVIFVFAIIAIVKAFSDESYRIPVIGDIAEKIFK